MNWPAILLFVAAIIGAIGAFWASNNQAKFEQELRKKSDEVAELNRLLATKSDEISSLTRDIAAYSKGEKSFCYFEPTVSSRRSAVLPALVSVGKNPLYDVRIRIVPNPHKLKLPKDGMVTYELLEEMMRTETKIDVGNLPPSIVDGTAYPSLILKWELPSAEDKLAFNIFFSARNDYFTQYLRFWRVNSRWFVASKVVRQLGGGEEGAILREMIQPGYPRNPDGKIDWHWTGN